MSALSIFEYAPIGAIIAGSDETPRPPERHSRKLAAWKNSNSQGRLIRKQGGRSAGTSGASGSFTLHEADFGAAGVIAIRVHRTFSLGSSLRFTIVERPPVGSVRVSDRAGDDAELVHLAAHRAAARHWLSQHGYPNAVLDWPRVRPGPVLGAALTACRSLSSASTPMPWRRGATAGTFSSAAGA